MNSYTMKTNISGAIRKTLKEEMERDPSVFLFGEDIADPYGGIHKATKGLSDHFGSERVINSPLSEIAIAGVGVGAAINGMRPVVEIMYADFLPIAMDQIVNCGAKMHFLSGGSICVPVVIRANYGSGKGEGAQHSQDPLAWFINYPGVKIVAPSTPRDAQGLLLSAIRDNNPVLFFEHKMLYQLTGEILLHNEPIPLGKMDVKRGGRDLTIIACGMMVHRALSAAKELSDEGIEAEVIDLRTLKPLDEEGLLESVRRTGRLMVVEESCRTGGWGAQVVDTAVEQAFAALKAAPVRLAALDAPLAARADFEALQIPSSQAIVEAARAMFQC